MRPEEVTKIVIETTRKSGKTAKLIELLPDEPCIVMLESIKHKDRFISSVKHIRPDYDTSNIQFVSYANSEWRNECLFRNKHLYIEHNVLDQMAYYQTKAINDVYGKGKVA